VFLCVIVYRVFVLNFWWCILRNVVNISYSPSQQCLVFLIRVIFTMSVFHCGMPRNWGGGRHNVNLGSTIKKLKRQSLCPPNFKTVSAPMLTTVIDGVMPDHTIPSCMCSRPTAMASPNDVC